MKEPSYYDQSVVELVDVSASDESVARAAWVSTVGEESRTKDPEKMAGLINYLIRERHGSPTEHNMFKFFIKTPLFVRSEFHRHRVGWSYNEASGRYSELEPDFYVPNESRKLTQVGKPGAYIFHPGSEEQYELASNEISHISYEAYLSYTHMLREGIAKEVARMVLPLNLMTTFYATCNARSLMNFLALRTERENAAFRSTPQWEIDDVATKMEAHFKEHMPITYEAWQKAGRVAP